MEIKIKKCEICSETEDSLIVHHINRNRGNNQLANLMALCPKCHIFVHKNYSQLTGKRNLKSQVMRLKTSYALDREKRLVAKIRRLANKKTLHEIAFIVGRSKSYVYSRLNRNYYSLTMKKLSKLK